MSGNAFNAYVNGTVLENQFTDVQVGEGRDRPPSAAVTPTEWRPQGDINAVHVYVYSALGIVTAEVIVAHAHSDAHYA